MQIVATNITPGQIHNGVLANSTTNGWLARLDCHIDAIVPRPLGSNGPELGDQVVVRLVAVDHATGSVVGSLISDKSPASIK